MKNERKNIVLIDFKNDKNWKFIKELSNSTNENWTIISKENLSKKKNKMKYLHFFTFPFKIYWNRKNFHKIVAWQQFYGLIFAFYCKLFKTRKYNSLYIMTFIYKERKGIKGKIYYKFIDYIVNSVYVDKIICFSKKESEYYANVFNTCKDKFTYTELGIEKIQRRLEISEKDYFLSVGRSNRDYNFLVESLKDTTYKLKILSDYYILNKAIDNIEVYNNVFNERYYKMLNECKGVILALDNQNISSGQLVILQAMQFRKPIIITKSNTIIDYVKNDYTAIIINKEKEELRKALEKVLTDDEYIKKITKNAYDDYNKRLTIEHMAQRIGNIIIENGDKNENCNDRT